MAVGELAAGDVGLVAMISPMRPRSFGSKMAGQAPALPPQRLGSAVQPLLWRTPAPEAGQRQAGPRIGPGCQRPGGRRPLPRGMRHMHRSVRLTRAKAGKEGIATREKVEPEAQHRACRVAAQAQRGADGGRMIGEFMPIDLQLVSASRSSHGGGKVVRQRQR